MCERCAEYHREVMEQINSEMDEQEVPADSLLRGLADIQIACEHQPILKLLMHEMYPDHNALMS